MSWAAGTSFDRPNTLTRSPQSTSPASHSHPPLIDTESARKRKRSSVAERESSLIDDDENGGSQGSPTTAGGKNRHQPGVKRACNDCRQQKLRCNVVAGPPGEFKPCARCIKHNLNCSIDNDFKRLGKRAAHEEMVRELDDCKRRLAEYEALGLIPKQIHTTNNGSSYGGSYSASPADTARPNTAPTAQMASAPFLGPSEAAASRSLLDLSQGYRELAPTSMPSITPGTTIRTLGGVTLSEEDLKQLFSIYFTSYHPWLPLLSPDLLLKADAHLEPELQTHRLDAYYNLHPLLHWTILAVAARRYDPRPGLLMELQQPLAEMLWTTLSQVPQTYHVVKALALLCSWPLPNSSTSQEPTMMLTGVMFQLAMQYGLHRPSHAQDFSRFRIDLREEDIADRLNTWAAVNTVAQNVATGQGQPPLSRWAWYTYGLHLDRMNSHLDTRCRIEKFVDTVTKTIFTMQRDHIVEVDQAQRGLSIDMYARELGELEITLLSTGTTSLENLYLKAAGLHLRLSAFFDKPTQPNYLADLRNCYIAASAMLTAVVDLPDESLLYAPRYVEQMILAAAVTLLKLLNSFFANHVDVPVGRTLFSRSVSTLRRLSVRSNDLPQRLAEVLAQLWHTSGQSEQRLFGDSSSKQPDDSLQLKVRCRSSLSVLFDAIWRWRQQAGQAGRDNLSSQAAEHPTAVATGVSTPSAHDAHGGPGDGVVGGLSTIDGGMSELDPMAWDGSYGGNAVFDPLSWALDGNLGFPNSNFLGADGLGF